VALKVIFRPQTEADLLALYRYSAEASGLGIAGGHIDRIEMACMSLATFPNAAPNATISHRDYAPVPSSAG
jgi:toxin ParE1/3/4